MRPLEQYWKFRALSVTFVPHLGNTLSTQFRQGWQKQDKILTEIQKIRDKYLHITNNKNAKFV